MDSLMNRIAALASMFMISFAVCAMFIARDVGPNYTIEDLDEIVGVEWNYHHSSNVIKGERLRRRLIESSDGQCSFYVSDFKVVEVFKGDHKVGDIFTAVDSIDDKDSEQPSSHLLFSKHINIAHYPGLRKFQCIPRLMVAVHRLHLTELMRVLRLMNLER